MKNFYVALFAALSFVFTSSTMATYKLQPTSPSSEKVSFSEKSNTIPEEKKLEKKDLEEKSNVKVVVEKPSSEDNNVVSKSPEKKVSPSRGGTSITENKVEEPSKYGELLDWWESVQNIFPNGSVAQVTDLNTGKSFNVKRTFGTNHADAEALTPSDTDIIKSIWGGFSWERRPVIVTVNEKRIAASMAAMPHAGVDSAPAVATVQNRSDGYGTGENLDAVKDNGMDGVVDIHFLNSTRHKDGREDPDHQQAILRAAGK
ncbi:MAG: hypothetical protein AB2417_11845 [Clostridiaceae bacterium]